MNSSEEKKLISRVIIYDDHKAFAKLMQLHQNGLQNLLLKLADFDESDMADLFQETCIKIYRNLKHFRGEAAFTTWCHRIAYNTFINATKKKKRYESLKDKVPLNSSISSVVNQNMKLDAEKMISILRPEEKAAIQLSYIQGFSHQDIADILQCPIGTVKSLIKRGKERISKNFKDD